MGLEQCTRCKEYYNPCATYEYNLSQHTFNNPFFPKENESIIDKEKDFLNVNFNTNNIEEKDEEANKKEEEKLKNLKKQILQKEQEKRKNKDNKNSLNVNLNEIITDDKSKEKITNQKINDLLENMCIYGSK